MTGKKESMEQIIKRMEGYGSDNNPRKVKAEAEEKVLSATAIMNDYFVGDLQGFSFKDDAATRGSYHVGVKSAILDRK